MGDSPPAPMEGKPSCAGVAGEGNVEVDFDAW